MVYKTVIQDGPEWLPKAVVCRVWTNVDLSDICTREIIGLVKNTWYVDTSGSFWRHAEPTEEWDQQEGEWVIAWYDNSEHIVIGKYVCKQEERYAVGHYSYPHIARLKNTDGSMVDLDCTIEELKQRTEWK